MIRAAKCSGTIRRVGKTLCHKCLELSLFSRCPRRSRRGSTNRRFQVSSARFVAPGFGLVLRTRIIKQPPGCFFLFWAAARLDSRVGNSRETLGHRDVPMPDAPGAQSGLSTSDSYTGVRIDSTDCSRLRTKFRLALALLATPRACIPVIVGLLRVGAGTHPCQMRRERNSAFRLRDCRLTRASKSCGDPSRSYQSCASQC